jgi:hypothetical protein
MIEQPDARYSPRRCWVGLLEKAPLAERGALHIPTEAILLALVAQGRGRLHGCHIDVQRRGRACHCGG